MELLLTVLFPYKLPSATGGFEPAPPRPARSPHGAGSPGRAGPLSPSPAQGSGPGRPEGANPHSRRGGNTRGGTVALTGRWSRCPAAAGTPRAWAAASPPSRPRCRSRLRFGRARLRSAPLGSGSASLGPARWQAPRGSAEIFHQPPCGRGVSPRRPSDALCRSAERVCAGSAGRRARDLPSMSSLTEKDRPIVQLLLSAGTCPRCVLRFCCVGSQLLYRHPHQDLMKDLQEFLKNSQEKEDTVCLDVADPPCKRIRLEHSREEGADDLNLNGAIPELPSAASGNTAMESSAGKVCNVCLGILQEFCEADFVKKVCQKVISADYQFTSFVFSVSLPPQLSVREHAAWLGMKQQMRNLGLPFAKDDIVQLKEAYKWIIHPQLSEELGVPADGKSLFEVSVVFAHPETDEECHFLATACPDCFKPAKNKQSVFTRMAVIKALERIKEEDFLKHFPCPPSSPKNLCDALEIECNNGAVFVAGRYNKYSRNLPQTPWIIDGERKLESSVEELISEHLMAEFKADSFNFSSSGREDVDVRTLGNGRPFAMELVNPRRIHFTAEEMKRLQQAINDSSDKIQVRDLQLVTREAIGHMKEGEEEKTKTYSALIWTDKAIQREDIAFLDDIKELKLDQKTPLRVLHRRPLAVRCRLIHTMKSEYIDEHHFRLHLKTQAGTYIKEFVHGDFGRTKPNIGSLLNRTADILELDVESVDVDWPPTLAD